MLTSNKNPAQSSEGGKPATFSNMKPASPLYPLLENMLAKYLDSVKPGPDGSLPALKTLLQTTAESTSSAETFLDIVRDKLLLGEVELHGPHIRGLVDILKSISKQPPLSSQVCGLLQDVILHAARTNPAATVPFFSALSDISGLEGIDSVLNRVRKEVGETTLNEVKAANSNLFLMYSFTYNILD